MSYPRKGSWSVLGWEGEEEVGICVLVQAPVMERRRRFSRFWERGSRGEVLGRRFSLDVKEMELLDGEVPGRRRKWYFSW